MHFKAVLGRGPYPPKIGRLCLQTYDQSVTVLLKRSDVFDFIHLIVKMLMWRIGV